MLCDNCILEIATGLSTETKKILIILDKGELHKAKLIEQSQLTYATTLKIINELASAKLINTRVRGKSIVCTLSDNGKRLLKLTAEKVFNDE